MVPTLQDRFRGCLLGLAIGDALGARFEAQSAQSLRERFPTVEALIGYASDELWYTDDTQMAIGVAETLVACGAIVEEELCKAFVANYTPNRGYGRGTRAVLEAMEEGRDYRKVAEKYFPGGSHGNGAAMRVAPVALFFHEDKQLLWEQARLSALPTHLNPLGIEGAQLLALGVALCLEDRLVGAPFDRQAFLQAMISASTPGDFHNRLEQAAGCDSVDRLIDLGNGIEALHSVPTSIASFALAPDSYSHAIGSAILLGGDTDTIAAMTGALSGARLGINGIPTRLVGLLEASPKGRDYLLSLADSLYERWRAGQAATAVNR